MIRCNTAFLALSLFFATVAAPLPLAAQAFNPDDAVQAEILPGWRDANGRHFAALRLALAPGWKTYWRVPGEAGIPPLFNFSGSDNVASVKIHWPLPEVFTINGLTSIGYSGDLVLPIEIAPGDSGESVALKMVAELGICLDICMPLALDLAADLGPAATKADPAILAAINSKPASAAGAGLRDLTCRLDPIADGLQLSAELVLPSTGGTEVAAVELVGTEVWTSPPLLVRDHDRLSLTADLVPPEGAPFALDRSTLRLTILGSDRVVEISGCPAG